MEEQKFPSNKRHAMLFRRHPSAINQNMVFSQCQTSKSGALSPTDVSMSSYHTPDTIEEALALSGTPLQLQLHHSKNAPYMQHLRDQSQSSGCYLEKQRSPASKEPKSRKTNFETIHTDATETHPAFESDAFAIQMPTTREPILDNDPIFRPNVPSSPSPAQLDAYQRYKLKAEQVRERNNSEGVRVPSKILSYDHYTYTTQTEHMQRQPQELAITPPSTPPSSPPSLSPAGSFPATPPMPQHPWTRYEQPVRIQPRGPRPISNSNNISIARKPLGLGNSSSTSTTAAATPRIHYAHHRGDASVGTTCSTPSSTPTKIKVRLKPVIADSVCLQKESWPGLYARSLQSSKGGSSRSSSPTKTIPERVSATSGAVDAVFGHESKDIAGTPAGKIESRVKKRQDAQKRSLTSRWAWLRHTAAPRIAKPSSAISPPITTTNIVPTSTSYTDPFILHHIAHTPTASRPASPKKSAASPSYLHSEPSTYPSQKVSFETGFAQIVALASHIIRLCVLVYALVAVYFLLDAIREAVHAMGAPFRAVKVALVWGWECSIWAFRALGGVVRGLEVAGRV